jgi:hypothetical protein
MYNIFFFYFFDNSILYNKMIFFIFIFLKYLIRNNSIKDIGAASLSESISALSICPLTSFSINLM